MCEAELNQLRPQRFPLAAEIRAQPGYLALQPPELVPLARSLDRPSE